jgi:hypothetical protein
MVGRAVSFALQIALRILWLGALIAFPFLLGLVLRVLGVAFQLVSLSVVSLFIGFPIAIDRVAGDWRRRAIAAGFPTEMTEVILLGCRSLAVLAIVSGWVILVGTSVLFYLLILHH